MGKVLVATVATGGAATVAVGGSFLVKHGLGEGTAKTDSDAIDDSSSTPPTKKEDKKLLFDSVDSFKKKSQDADCVKRYFNHNTTHLDISTGESSATEIAQSKPGDGEFFKADATGTITPYESCLLVNWKTDTYTKDSASKWKGIFTWLWTFVRGDEGFINFNLAKTSDKEDGKLIFEGAFYLVSKKSDGSWELKYKKEVIGDDKKVEVKDLDSYFPKRGTGIKDGKDEYWGFFKNTTSGQQLQDVCGNSADCNGTSSELYTEVIEMSWEGTNTSSGDSNKLQAWSKDLTWWDNIYGSSPWDFKDKIKNYSGTWISKNKTTTSDSSGK